MKVYAAPEGITLNIDYTVRYNPADEQAKVEKYKAEIKDWLLSNGYTGPNTGETITFPVADGRAEYMLGDKGRGGILIHLDIMDGYQYFDIKFLPKAEILRRIEQEKAAKAFWKSRKA